MTQKQQITGEKKTRLTIFCFWSSYHRFQMIHPEWACVCRNQSFNYRNKSTELQRRKKNWNIDVNMPSNRSMNCERIWTEIWPFHIGSTLINSGGLFKFTKNPLSICLLHIILKTSNHQQIFQFIFKVFLLMRSKYLMLS